MFDTNPVITSKGIFRKDTYGEWWLLEKRILGDASITSPIPITKVIEKIAKISEGLKEPALAEQNNAGAKEILVIGWNPVYDVKEIASIEKSINAGRMIIDPLFKKFEFSP